MDEIPEDIAEGTRRNKQLNMRRKCLAKEIERKSKDTAEIEEKFKEHVVVQQDKNILRREHIELLRQQEVVEWE